MYLKAIKDNLFITLSSIQTLINYGTLITVIGQIFVTCLRTQIIYVHK